MRPSKLKADKLQALLEKLGIQPFKTKSKMNLRQPENSYDYVFERVIERRGFFIMTWASLKEWEHFHPKMIQKLKAKGIDMVTGTRHIKFISNGIGIVHAN